jgi:hypothetical protein
MPRCSRCNLEIEPSQAVPYLDDYGQPILDHTGDYLYRDWCMYHWSKRRNALPPSHPNFLRPLSPATRAKERKWLMSQGYLNIDHQIAPAHGINDTISNKRASEILTSTARLLPRDPGPPPTIDATRILEQIRNPTEPLFPKFEWLGRHVSTLGPEELSIIWEDYDASHNAQG